MFSPGVTGGNNSSITEFSHPAHSACGTASVGYHTHCHKGSALTAAGSLISNLCHGIDGVSRLLVVDQPEIASAYLLTIPDHLLGRDPKTVSKYMIIHMERFGHRT